jgi:hypothetical protein
MGTSEINMDRIIYNKLINTSFGYLAISALFKRPKYSTRGRRRSTTMQDSDDDNTRASTWNGRDRVAMLCQYGERSVFVRASHPHETIEEPYDVYLSLLGANILTFLQITPSSFCSLFYQNPDLYLLNNWEKITWQFAYFSFPYIEANGCFCMGFWRDVKRV